MDSGRSGAPARILRFASGVLFAAFAAAAAAAEPERPAELAVPAAETLAAVHARYAAATNVSCTVRRRISAGSDEAPEVLSRVAWARGGFLNVQRLAPEAGRTVIDGTTVWTSKAGEGSPSRRPVGDQSALQAANLFSVPGSPEEHLAPFDPATAADVAPPAAPWARQVAFRFADTNAPAASAVVSFDDGGFVARVDAFHGEGGTGAPAWSVVFLTPVEPLPGVRFYRRVETETLASGRTVRTVSTFDRLRVNGPLPAAVFDPAAFF